MSTVINTNLASLFAQNSLANAQNNLATSVQRLSSGLRINSAKDDAAGLAISQSMQGQINGTSQSIRNLSNATNLLQTADTSLSSIQDMLLSMKQLAVQGYDGSLSASQKLNIVQQLKDLNNEINATAQRTAFNGVSLLTSGASLDLVNSDLRAGATLNNTAVAVSNISGLGASGTLSDTASTKNGAPGTATGYTVTLDPTLSPKTPGTYALSYNGNQLTLSGTFNGQSQSQTVVIADAAGNAAQAGANDKSVPQTLNFSNFGISINLTGTISPGATETGAQLASAIVAKSSSIVVGGVGGAVSDVRLSGAAAGTYTMTYEGTGGISNLSLPANSANVGVSQNAIQLVGGSGSGATANVTIANGQVTGMTINNAGTGYKAGDVLSIAQQGITETGTATFNAAAMAVGDSMTFGGLTFTATASTTQANAVAAFANLANGATTGAGTTGYYTGTLAGWSTGSGVGGTTLTFTSATAAAPVADLTTAVTRSATGSVVSPTLATTTGYGTTESTSVAFNATSLTAGQTMFVGGLTYTSTGTSVRADVATAFAGLTNGATQGLGTATGTYSGTFTGWTSGASNGTTVVFTSVTPGTNVTDLAITGTGASPVQTKTQGLAGTGETDLITFNATPLTAGQTVILGGLTYTSTAGTSAAQLATEFQNLVDGATTGAAVTGTYTGTLTGWKSSALSGTTVTFTSTNPGNVTNVNITNGTGAAPTLTTETPGVGGNTQAASASFQAMSKGDTVTMSGTSGGLTLAATTAMSASDVANAFANLSAGATAGSGTGIWSGTLVGYSSGSANGSLVTFTSNTPNVGGVTALTTSSTIAGLGTAVAATIAKTDGLTTFNAMSGIAVGSLNSYSNSQLKMSGTVDGVAVTQSLSLGSGNAANAVKTINFDKFGIQFDVTSYQAQTADQLGAAIAGMNSGSNTGLFGTSGTAIPGQVVVAQGNNSALKFQSGATSNAFIQVDTLNVQTGSSGTTAGTAAEMMTLGTRITSSTNGNVGGLGLSDSASTWQTAFQNIAAAVDSAVDYISSKRATFGSQMNRLSNITTNLNAQNTNLQNSRSAITDTDFASETSKLTKGQIMQQAATAMLAQANQMPNVILSLLK